MAASRVGARELGLQVQWRFDFVPAGASLQPRRDAVILDVGGALGPGIVDQHQDGNLGACAAELVVRYPEYAYGHLMDDWLRRRDDGQDLKGRAFSPALVLHYGPDFDSLVAVHLVQRLVEDGELPSYASALAQYAALVDQGKYQVDLKKPETATSPMHMGYLALQYLQGERPSVAQTVGLLEAGIRSIEATTAAWVAKDFKVALQDCAEWRTKPEFAAAAKLLDGDFKLYMLDKANADLYGDGETHAAVELPLNGSAGITRAAKAFVLRGHPRSALNKYWVRADGYPYFVCPYDPALKGKRPDGDGNWPSGYAVPAVFGQVMVSVDPLWRDPTTSGTLSLYGLGRALELAECIARAAKGGPHRSGVPRWTDGSVNNADPWYDGRGHDHAIVDSPRSLTVLAYNEIVAIATRKFFETKLASVEIYLVQPASLDSDAHQGTQSAHLPRPEELRSSLGSLYDDWDAGGLQAGGFTPGGSDELEQYLRNGGFQVAKGARPPPKCLTATEGRPAVSPTLLTISASWQASEGSAAKNVTLDELVRQVEAADKASGHRAYVVANVRLAAGQVKGPHVDALLERLCLGKADRTTPEGVSGLVLFNGRAIAEVPGRDGAGQPGHGDLLKELLTYAAFQSETLAGFTLAIAKGVDSRSLEMAALAELRRQFVAFQAKYVVLEPVRNAGARLIFKGICDSLGLEAQHAKLNSEIERLEQLSRDRAEEAQRAAEEIQKVAADRMNKVLFFVGLTGVIQAAMSDWGELPGFADFGAWIRVGLLLAGLAATWWGYRWMGKSEGAVARGLEVGNGR